MGQREHREERVSRMKKMRHSYTEEWIRGASGRTNIQFTPQSERRLEMDITNCPHCGNGHASIPVELNSIGLAYVTCPSTGGRPVFFTLSVRLSLTPSFKPLQR